MSNGVPQNLEPVPSTVGASVPSSKSTSRLVQHSTLRRLTSSTRSRIGLSMMFLVLLVAILGPIFAPHTASEIVGLPYEGPGNGHLLGTDNGGQDVFSRLLRGGRSLVWMSIAAAVLAVAAGTAIGLMAAFSKGRLDALLMRCLDVLLAFPSIVLVLLFVSVLGPRPWLLVVLVAVTQMPSIARVMRGAAMPVIERDYVEWCRAGGMGTTRILTREVLPNVASPLLVELGLRLMWCISLIAGLSYLGYGLQPPAADWGLMVNQNRNALAIQPWSVLAPIAAIAVFTIGGNLLTEGMARSIARTEGRRG
jgi:peptide/nickel transport system permease protein